VVQVTAAAPAADSIRADVVIEKLADLPDAIARLAEPARRG
jgi:hypothetical protein